MISIREVVTTTINNRPASHFWNTKSIAIEAAIAEVGNIDGLSDEEAITKIEAAVAKQESIQPIIANANRRLSMTNAKRARAIISCLDDLVDAMNLGLDHGMETQFSVAVQGGKYVFQAQFLTKVEPEPEGE